MKVIVVMKGYEFSLEVESNEPILQIKSKIHQLLGLPIDSQVLKVCDWELVDGLDLDDYPLISEGTKMYLTTASPSIPLFPNGGKMKIMVKFSNRKIEIEVDHDDTVETLKEKIHIVDGTSIRRMTLFFNGVEMEEEFLHLSEYGIHEFSEVLVFTKSVSRVMMAADPPVRRVRLVVQTSSSLLNATKIPVEMNDSSRVDELRQLLLERRVLPIDEYIFIHQQRIMRDDCSLRWHGVENGDFLYVFKGTVSQSGV